MGYGICPLLEQENTQLKPKSQVAESFYPMKLTPHILMLATSLVCNRTLPLTVFFLAAAV